jgi:hypothetical protein
MTYTSVYIDTEILHPLKYALEHGIYRNYPWLQGAMSGQFTIFTLNTIEPK